MGIVYCAALRRTCFADVLSTERIANDSKALTQLSPPNAPQATLAKRSLGCRATQCYSSNVKPQALYEMQEAVTGLTGSDNSDSSTAAQPEPRTPSSPGAAPEGTAASKKHLVVLQHGLFGSYLDWNAVVDALKAELGGDGDRVLVHATAVNNRQKSQAGIDVCAERLADEILVIKAEHPSLEFISLVGLSIGGLICRYVAALILEPETGRMAGLKPALYVSIASPHIGLSVKANAIHAAGFYEWTEMHHGMSWRAKVLYQAHKFLLWITRPLPIGFLNTTAGRSAVQLFHLDGGKNGAVAPLLDQMTLDNDKGLKFMSALAAFESRTAYANAIGDQWISWSSGSIRSLGELPTIDISSGRPCIIQEDLLPPQQQQKSTSGESLAHAESQPLFEGSIGETSSALDITSHPVEDVDLELDAEVLLKRLQLLHWNRVDVSFYNATANAARASHDLIIQGLPVQRSPFLEIGNDSVRHIAAHIAGFLKK